MGRLDIGGAIQYFLCRKQWPHEELAFRMGLPVSNVSVWVRGAKQLTPPSVERIIAGLEVSAAEFFEIAERGDLEMFRDPLVREVAKRMPLKKCERNDIVRFINLTARRKTA